MISFCFINSFRYSCEIEFEDKIVITGGSDNSETYGEPLARVTSYTYDGFLADLPEMNEARKQHGCTYFINNDDKIVSTINKITQSIGQKQFNY